MPHEASLDNRTRMSDVRPPRLRTIGPAYPTCVPHVCGQSDPYVRRVGHTSDGPFAFVSRCDNVRFGVIGVASTASGRCLNGVAARLVLSVLIDYTSW